MFLPVHGGWGKMGITHIRLAVASEDLLSGALHTAWKLCVDKNQKPTKKPGTSTKSSAIRTTAKPRSKKAR